MADDKETTPPPKTASATVDSSPSAPTPKRARMSSPSEEEATPTSAASEPARQAEVNAAAPSSSATYNAAGNNVVQPEDDLEAADQESLYGNDSALGTDHSDTTSIASSIYAGYMENGRRYQIVREGEYWGPSDEKQFESMNAGHIAHLVLDSKQKNHLFHSPIPENPQAILDLGTGTGIWAKDVADMHPSAVVVGVDLYPPPDTWVPPNCRLEVDDALKPWEFKEKPFDLIHLRWLLGSFTNEQWRLLYKQAYKNLLPGGYIEQVEPCLEYFCDDGSVPRDATINKWGDIMTKAAAKSGKDADTFFTMRDRIEAAGFTNVREKIYKVPMGEWTKNPILKEAGKYNKLQLMSGQEGYAIYLLTKFAEPEPWTPDEVQVFSAKIRQEVNNTKYHAYVKWKRVWAQKPPVEKTNVAT